MALDTLVNDTLNEITVVLKLLAHNVAKVLGL